MMIGAVSGMLMASVFVGAGTVMLFALVRETPPAFQPLFRRYPPANFVLPMVILAYPTWAVIGAVIGLFYDAVTGDSSRSGLGSSNLAFTLVIILTAALILLPVVFLFRRFWIGTAVIAFTFTGIFGWFLPLFAP